MEATVLGVSGSPIADSFGAASARVELLRLLERAERAVEAAQPGRAAVALLGYGRAVLLARGVGTGDLGMEIALEETRRAIRESYGV